MLAITQLKALSLEPVDLELDASQQGFNLLSRLIDEWLTGSNRFDKPAERLLVTLAAGNIVGTGGRMAPGGLSAPRSGRARQRIDRVGAHLVDVFPERDAGELACRERDGKGGERFKY